MSGPQRPLSHSGAGCRPDSARRQRPARVHDRTAPAWLGVLLCVTWVLLVACGPGEPTEFAPPPASGGGKSARPRPPTAQSKEHALLQRVAINPSDLDARLTLAHVYFDTRRTALAIPLYLQVLERRPEDHGVRTDLATCYKRVGRLDEARAELEKVLASSPTHMQATYNLAVVTKMMGDPLTAADLWERAAHLTADPKTAATARSNAAACRREAAGAAPSSPGKTSPPRGPR